MTQLLSYIFYFTAATVSLLQFRWLSTHKNYNNKGQIRLAFYVMCFLVAGSLILPFFQPFYFAGDPWLFIAMALTCGIFGAGNFICFYSAQKYVEVGVSNLLHKISGPITIVLASLFLNEKLTSWQIFGTVLLLGGMLIVSKKHKIGKFKFDKYFLLMLSSGVMIGVLLVTERALQKMTGFTAGTMVSWGMQCLCLGIASIVMKDKNTYSFQDIAVTGVLRYLQALSWVTLVFVVGNISLVSSITAFNVVIIFITAAILLKERDNLPRKILGSLIALGGLLLMR